MLENPNKFFIIENLLEATNYKQLSSLIYLNHWYSGMSIFYKQHFAEVITSLDDLKKYESGQQLKLVNIMLLACIAYAALSKFKELEIVTSIIIDLYKKSNLISIHN